MTSSKKIQDGTRPQILRSLGIKIQHGVLDHENFEKCIISIFQKNRELKKVIFRNSKNEQSNR